MATIKEIADACELSVITVSRALRKENGVSPRTRERIMAYAKKVGYRPNLIAQNLRKGRTYMVAAIVNNYADEFIGSTLKGIQRELHSHDYQMMALEWGADESEETADKLIKSIIGRNVDGILMARWGHPRETRFFDEIVALKIPMVALDREPFLASIPFVGTDDRSGARDATEYLISRGHEKIGHLSGPLDSSPGKERLLGFYEAMSKHGLRVNADWVIEGEWRYEKSEHKTAQKFFDSCKDLPTAVFAASDILAASLIQVALKQGVKVPEDLSVMGFTDERIADMMVPSITTMHQSPVKIGIEGAKLLVKLIEKQDMEQGNDIQSSRIMVKTRLVERDSVKDISSGKAKPEQSAG